MSGEHNETEKKQNSKGQSIAVIVLVVIFWLQLPSTNFKWVKHLQTSYSTTSTTRTSDIMKTENLKQSKAQVQANMAWQLVLVNEQNPLPKDFTVDLVKVQGDYKVDYRIAPEVKQMIADGRAAGIQLKICSAFRTVNRQEGLYDKKVKNYLYTGTDQTQAELEAASIVARAGESEHHTGLALDIITPTYQTLDEGFAKTAAFAWLTKNAENYGFVLRYPEDKQDITGITFEPWHYRYVGAGNAKAMNDGNVCLEEYSSK